MRLDQIVEASKLAANLTDAEADLQNAKNARKLTQVFADHSPRIGIPERRKKSSGASLPSIVKTTSLEIVSDLPVASRSVAEFASIFCTDVSISRRTEPGALSPRM